MLIFFSINILSFTLVQSTRFLSLLMPIYLSIYLSICVCVCVCVLVCVCVCVRKERTACTCLCIPFPLGLGRKAIVYINTKRVKMILERKKETLLLKKRKLFFSGPTDCPRNIISVLWTVAIEPVRRFVAWIGAKDNSTSFHKNINELECYKGFKPDRI